MKMSASLHGAADLRKRLSELPQAVSTKVQRQALLTGAEPLRAAAAALAPRDEQSSGPHLADNIVIGVQSRRKLGQSGLSASEMDLAGEGTIVEVGPALQPSNHFYGRFQEFGTIHRAAQPFMRPAFDAQGRTSLRLVMASLWAAIKKTLPSNGRSTTGGNL